MRGRVSSTQHGQGDADSWPHALRPPGPLLSNASGGNNMPETCQVGWHTGSSPRSPAAGHRRNRTDVESEGKRVRPIVIG